jgi:hypothetical protein
MELAANANRPIEGKVDGEVMVRAGHIFELVQGKAKELVAEVSSLPEFSDLIWISGSSDLSMGDGWAASGVLIID